MKPRADPEHLLDDVLDENADFRARSLEALLREARRQQCARRRTRSLLVLAAAFLVGGTTMMLWKPGTPGGVSVVGETPDNKSGSLTLVRSGRLPAAMLIETGNPSVPVIHSTPSAVVQTSRDTPILLEIGDGELFTLLAGRPAALVRLQSGQAELLLLDGADQALLQSHHQLLPRGILNYPR